MVWSDGAIRDAVQGMAGGRRFGTEYIEGGPGDGPH